MKKLSLLPGIIIILALTSATPPPVANLQAAPAATTVQPFESREVKIQAFYLLFGLYEVPAPYAFIYDEGTISGDYANAQGWVIFDTEVDYVITADGIGSYHGSHVITDAEWEAAYVKIVMTP